MATHRFNDPKDPTRGGTWFGEHGRRICDWSWDATTKTMKVTRYARVKRSHLVNIGEQLLTPEGLQERLPQLALESVQRITKKH
jgi:hypothetical protein